MTLFGDPEPRPEQDQFEHFWELYPKKVAKAHAMKMWIRLRSDEREAAIMALPFHVALWSREHRDPSKIPNAGTWLNPKDGRRWEDELYKNNRIDSGNGKYDKFVRK